MADERMAAQAMYHAHIEYGEEKPAWMQMALEIVNSWGRAEATLAHAIAIGLEEAHRMGREGEEPVYTPPTVQRFVRRAKPAPEPTTTRQLVRRTR